MRTVLRTLLICQLVPAALAFAQETPPPTASAATATAATDNPFSAHARRVYAGLKPVLLRSAEKVPEESYGFKPTESVRSFGQVVGHIADSQYLFCSQVLGEKDPELKIEKTKTSKADLVAALKTSFAYCDKAYEGMTDVSGARMVNLFGRDTPRLSVLDVNNLHAAEHYGNLVTYMRLKNIVPPTSEPKGAPEAKK